ncbi:MAG: right-handed parallel beta-helix repeat-containing protein, partial [Clostridia bacterium]|nr:right-handed parallel beta-helix repeat-containing protein [Clostridia bacterium]
LTELRAPTFTHAQATDVPRIGDTIEVTRIATLEPVLRTVVTDVDWAPRSLQVRVRLAQIPDPVGDDDYYLFNASKIPTLEFRGNRVLGNFARGVLSKARKAVIEDNYFQGCTGTAIHVGAESGWKEGAFAEEATIRRNRIVNCGQSHGMQGGACGIAVLIDAPDTRDTFIHGAVTVEDNDIVSALYPAECGIAVFNADRVTLGGNRISGCKDAVHTHAVRELTGASRGGTQLRKSLNIWDIDNQFAQPDPCYRPYVRWWWNGDRVEPSELIRELHVMKDAGIGGVEISPIAFPSGADSLGRPALRWLSDEWIDCVQTVFDETQRLGMGCDLLVGSGWPFGSETLKPQERASIMIAVARPLKGGRRHTLKAADLIEEGKPTVTIVNPDMHAEIVSLLLVPEPCGALEEAVDVRGSLKDGVLSLSVPRGDWQLHALIRYDSFASVINGAPGAAGSQIDYMNADAIRAYLDRMADAIEARTGPLSEHLRAFFVDNMELEGCNWTPDFAAEFQRRRGYDIMPWFPFILFKMLRLGDVLKYSFGGAKTPEFQDQIDRVRYDFEITRMELNYERYTRTFQAWCREKGVLSRAQAYGRGFWPLDSSLDYDIPEGESWTTNWLRHRVGEEMGDEDYRRGRAYTMVNKYVSSAAHIAGKRVVSAEEMTNTYLVFRTPLEFLKVGSDMAAFSGITHSVWHGFNYSPLEAPFPGWVQYGTFHNERNTWWPYVRFLNDYRARMSAVLQNVDPVAPIAILPANGDLWSELGAQNEPFPVRLNTQWTSILWEAIAKNGGGADYVSEGVLRDSFVANGLLHCRHCAYSVLFLAGLKGIDEAVLDVVEAFVRGGGRVFCVGGYPCKSLGYLDFAARDAAIVARVEALAQAFPERFVALEMPENDKGWLEWYAAVQERYGLPHAVTITRP